MKTAKVKHARVGEAIDRLAALFEYGALQASTDPAEFLDRVTAEIVGLRALTTRPPPSETSPGGAPKCHCTYEAGDSPCPMHGMEEPEPPPPGPKPPKIRNLTRPASPSTETRAEGERCGRCGGEGWHWDADIRSGKAKCFDCGGTGTRRGSNG